MSSTSPRIVPREQHPISRRQFPPNVLHVLYQLHRRGYLAYLVGGGVRDLLLDRKPKDMDIVTDATPEEVRRVFRNCRLIGRRFRLAHVHFGEEIVEVATFRCSAADVEEDNGMVTHPGEDPGALHRREGIVRTEDGLILRDNLFGTPEQDAWRRDFTVNALYYNIADYSIIDWVGGLEDLENRLIRSIGDPDERFTEDPVRMIRAIRFAAMLDLDIEANTYRALLDQREGILRASSDRMYEETLKLFLMGAGERTYRLLRETGLFELIFPSSGIPLHGHPDPMGFAFRWVDERVAEGHRVPPHMLYAFMFGQAVEERALHLLDIHDLQPVQAYNHAVSELSAHLEGSVRLANRSALLMREILANQYRFRRTAPRFVRTFLRMPCFHEALEYFRFRTDMLGEDHDLLAWWEAHAGGAPIEGPGPGDREPAHPSRRGRRRRHHGRGRGHGRSGERPASPGV